MPTGGPNKTGDSGRLSPDDVSAPGDPLSDRALQNRDERALLLRFRDTGDRAAFDELVRRTEPRVRAVALALLRDPAAAEDAAQEAFLRAFRRASGYRGDGPVGAWLCRIAVRAAQTSLRRLERRRRLADLLGAAPPRSAPPDLRLRAELASALRRLPPAEREGLLLKEIAGMTYREIADSSGTPLGTVQSRIHRARRRLARALGGEDR